MGRKTTPPNPADVARCAPAILTAMLSQPVAPTPTMYVTLVAGRESYCYPDVLTTTSYATIEDWVTGESVRNHPNTTWIIRIINTSVEVGTYVVYVDGRGDVLTMHASTVNVVEMVRYYAGGMAGDLGATLDTCHTAYDVVSAVCNHLVATGNDPFYIDGEMVALMMYTGDYHSPLTNQDMGAYAELWYKSYDAAMAEMVAAVCNRLVATGWWGVYSMGASVVAGGLSMAYDEIEYYFEHWYNDEGHKLNTDWCRGCGCEITGDGVRCGVCGRDVSTTDDGWCECLDVATTDDDDNCCRGCGCEIFYPVSHVYDEEWYCGMCYTDMVARGE
jgi:hypothetical protein